MAKKRLKMTTSSDVRKALNRIANMLLNDEITVQKANAITYSAKTILEAIRVDDYLSKLDELEGIIESLDKN